MNDFDRIAPVYDFLTRFVFFGSIQKAQRTYLDVLKSGDRVLVLGGGTAKFLEYFEKGIKIDFVEPSAQMQKRAKGRKTKAQVSFHQVKLQNFEISQKYDVVICPFFLDLFNETHLTEIIVNIKQRLKPSSRLIVADFDADCTFFWAKALSRLMHGFFQLTSNLESRKLKNIDYHIQNAGLEIQYEHHFYSGFIFSRIYSMIKRESSQLEPAHISE